MMEDALLDGPHTGGPREGPRASSQRGQAEDETQVLAAAPSTGAASEKASPGKRSETLAPGAVSTTPPSSRHRWSVVGLERLVCLLEHTDGHAISSALPALGRSSRRDCASSMSRGPFIPPLW
jgi:hypothetical protein